MEIIKAKKLIQGAIDSVAAGSQETAFQKNIGDELKARKVQFERHLRDGNQPDFYIHPTAADSGILLELKPNGDWTNVGKAAAQLWTYVRRFPEDTILLAVFGSRLQHAHHAEMLRELKMQCLEATHPFPIGRVTPRRRDRS
jgi:hypothetical protein